MFLFGRHRTMKKKITLNCLEEPTSKVGRVLADSFQSGEFISIMYQKSIGGCVWKLPFFLCPRQHSVQMSPDFFKETSSESVWLHFMDLMVVVTMEYTSG
jgi:hypothetical protein